MISEFRILLCQILISPLSIVVTPRCKKGHEQTRIGVLHSEEVQVQCHVDSVPEVNRFSWTYNTSRDVLRVQGSRVKNKGGVSTLHFKPPSSGDEVQSLSCWAVNDVGRQEKPCVFIIVPAGE
ncbi:hypothetical protein HHI36_000445 [Cryptolaemus montrouzieri]|uniref:Ig-like domain-containing protein n=1 Tax=Cryptolaemus montrouzieri TaxID=559131 RepID=A0ABD2P5D5_9CUCU